MPNNRIWNVSNPYQGEAHKVLCVCSAGLLRSPTAANVLHKEFGYNTRACGTDTDHALIPLDTVLCHWADEIVCMESRHAHEITAINPKFEEKLTCLQILDDYSYMDEDLQALIKQRYLENVS